eukprot:TRINITY_DN18354_c0_g1_i1.p1 TRINITY_DN18354_c0_g1~~TRINITY_DN18354_c0_g1_i1.p1  ORF type:complete len:1704 (-),score=470.71 TRINITY_DN18354_c0_g1_i1:9-5120(-)
MAQMNALFVQPTALAFGVYSPEEIRKLSVLNITEAISFDLTGAPTKGGLYDPKMGPFGQFIPCETCGLVGFKCPGHLGHIELVLPVYNPLYFHTLVRLLKVQCFNCHKFRVNREVIKACIKVMIKLDQDKPIDAMEVYTKAANMRYCKKLIQSWESGFPEVPAEDEEKIEEQDKNFQKEKERLQQVIKQYEREDRMFQKYISGQKKIDLPHFAQRNSLVESIRRAAIDEIMKPKTGNQCSNCSLKSQKIKGHQKSKIFIHREPIKKRGKKVEDEAKSEPRTVPVPADKGKEKDEEEEDEDVIGSSAASDVTRKQKSVAKGLFKDESEAGTIDWVYLPPTEIQKHMDLFFENEKDIVNYIFGFIKMGGSGGEQGVASKRCDSKMFFIEVLPVPPSKYRPVIKSRGQENMFQNHPQNGYYLEVIRQNALLMSEKNLYLAKKESRDPNATGTEELSQTLLATWLTIQTSVNELQENQPGVGNTKPAGIKQLLEKKEGLFRKNMMGKRVNYAARSVIGPDPYIETNEIGVPLAFAMKLTYPVCVTEQNVAWLRQLVMNGPNIYPGANGYEDEHGRFHVLRAENEDERIGVSKMLRTSGRHLTVTPKKVYRHLMNGDVVLVNRQPTLHKPSMMTHKVKVLNKQKTLRLHYANCNTYNADFDGDEMNVHFPQNEMARSEGYGISLTDYQYIVPRNGTPLRGLIQDHIVMAVILTSKDTFLTRAQYQQLHYTACFNVTDKLGVGSSSKQIRMLWIPPAVMKPQPLWTGKQVITTILNQLTQGLPPMNMESKAKISGGLWGSSHTGEAQVLIQDNELLTGILDKSQVGAAQYGLVHAYYELYGPERAGKFLTVLGRLLTQYLHMIGFTCGIDDLILEQDAEASRRTILDDAYQNLGMETAKKFVGLDGKTVNKQDVCDALKTVLKSHHNIKTGVDLESVKLDNVMKGAMNKVTEAVVDVAIPEGLIKRFPKNNMSMMTQSGAKGSTVNASQISCLLGQMELEGRRVAQMVSGKTLPSFDPYDPANRAGGYIADRFLTGIRPQEYFFHCMAGREGLVDTAVKTSRSGYLQRCLIKHLESLKVCYDGTVRDNDGSVVQFRYGEDGIDVMKTKYITEEKMFKFFYENIKILEWKVKMKEVEAKMSDEEVNAFEKKRQAALEDGTLDIKKQPATLQSEFIGFEHLGVTSEKFKKELDQYCYKLERESGTLNEATRLKIERFKKLMKIYYYKCNMEPGEYVGLLAAQSIGEPSTQMTLNTFHLAGRGDANVTLGIPRLKELLMTASKVLKTPSMVLKLKPDMDEAKAEDFANKLYRLLLIHLVSEIKVNETVMTPEEGKEGKQRVYDVEIKFKDENEWGKTGLKWSGLMKHLGGKFSAALTDLMKKRMNIRGGVEVRKRGKKGDDEDDVEEEEGTQWMEDQDNNSGNGGRGQGGENDGDVESTRQRSRKKESASYEDADEEDKALLQNQERQNEKQQEEEEEEEQDDGKMKEDDKIETIALEGDSWIKDVRSSHSKLLYFVKICLPVESKRLLMANLVEDLCTDYVLSEVRYISKCFLESKKLANGKDLWSVSTEGANFYDLFKYQRELEVNEMMSNDVYLVLQVYGVEAARRLIVKEVSGVFGHYGITVDARHLGLIADYMTFEGQYKPFSRGGMESNVSVLQQMSFETTMAFLVKSTTQGGSWDNLTSPSSSIVVGNVVQGGTGMFDLVTSLAN